MLDHCEDTIKAVQAHMRCGWDDAVDMLDNSSTQAEVDRLTGYTRDRDEYQEHRDAQLTGDCGCD